MNSKFTLALIALVGIGVFALPSTMALFAGQHTFYNIDATGNQVPCQKCHGDVKVELSGDTAMAGSKAPHADFRCEYCHRSEAGMSSGDDAYAKITYSSSTGTRIALVTTIANFENGNFPKGIQYTAGMTVDNWLGNVYALDGVTPWVNISAYDTESHVYGGNLSINGVAGTRYNYSYASETSTRTGGLPKDTNPATKDTAFNPRGVTWPFATNTTESLVGAGSSEVTPGTRYHAASLVSCMECHGGEQAKGAPGYEIETAEPYNHAGWLLDATDGTSTCGNCHYGTAAHTPAFETALEAGGFGLTGGNDTGATEAHKEFVTSDSQGILRSSTEIGSYGASNIACVACHTHVAVDINFQKKYKVKLDAYGMSTGNWSVGGYAAEGTVNVATYGNSDGSVFGTGNKSYSWTPTSTLYVNGNASQVILGLNNDTNDNKTALTTP